MNPAAARRSLHFRIIRLLPQPAASILSGRILFEGKIWLPRRWNGCYQVRGDRIGMIFQEPMTALNPVHRIGRQITEAVKLHRDISDEQAIALAVEMLDKVGIPSPRCGCGNIPTSFPAACASG